LDQVIRVLFEEVIDGVVGPILIVLIVGNQDRGSLRDIFGLLNVEKGLDPVSYQVLGVKNVIQALCGLHTLLSDEVLFVVDANEDPQRRPYKKEVLDLEAELKLEVIIWRGYRACH
jgi:hypothetical protein